MKPKIKPAVSSDAKANAPKQPLTPETAPPPLLSSPDWQVRQHPERAQYDRASLAAILEAGLICHLGIVIEDRPVVIPMAYALDGDRILIHGSRSSRLIEALASGRPYSLTVTHLDGLVLARSALHHSMNYRSAVVHGRGSEILDEAEKWAALDAIVEQLVPGRVGELRPMRPEEVKATRVVALQIEAASVKRREGPPVDAARDRDRPDWSGVVPLRLIAGLPERESGPEQPLPPSVQRTLGRFASMPPILELEEDAWPG